MSFHYRTDPSGFRKGWSDAQADLYLAGGHWQSRTLVDVARAAAQADPSRLLLIEGERRLTRGEAWNQALRLASFFLARGLKRGDVISMQLPNWTETAIIALAARMTGLVINPLPPIYREAELRYMLQDCRARLLFIPGQFRKHDYPAMVAALRDQLPDLKDVVAVRGEGPLRLENILAQTPAAGALPAVDPADVMMVMYTSGTTGRAKGVLHTHYSFDHRVRAMGEAWNIGRDDVVFMPSPVTHITGAFWIFDMPWVRECSSVLMDMWSPEEGLRCIEEHGCTVSSGATPFLQQMLSLARRAPEKLSSLRLFSCGGTAVPPGLMREASALFPHSLFFRAYGSTEMPCATLGIRDRANEELGAVTDGEIVPPVQVRMIDGGGGPAAPGEEGAIWARGPGLFAGYADPRDNEGCFDEDGFFAMGDLGRRVHDDYLVITGRTKDIIIRSGENISPKEVEDILSTHPAIAEIAIVAMPDPRTGEIGCAFLIPEQGETIDLAEISRFLDGFGVARQKYPEHLVVADDFPRVPSGKVRKDVLRQRAADLATARA